MKKQQGSAEVVLVIVLVAMIIGLLGFIVWQNLANKDGNDTTINQPNTNTGNAAKDEPDETKSPALNISELAVDIDLTGAPFSDIKYAMTSPNSDDTHKYVAAVYSEKVLNDRIAALKRDGSTQDYTQSYWKYSSNNAVYVYWYDPNERMIGSPVAINPASKDASSKLYVGFMGPVDAGADNIKLREWLQNNI